MKYEYDVFTLDELREFYSDFFKRLFGYRPLDLFRYKFEDSKEELILAVNCIDDVFLELQESKVGREYLRSNGWHITEPGG
jgi:hypothetical protein